MVGDPAQLQRDQKELTAKIEQLKSVIGKDDEKARAAVEAVFNAHNKMYESMITVLDDLDWYSPPRQRSALETIHQRVWKNR